MDALQADVERLRVAIDAVVPADDFSSANPVLTIFANAFRIMHTWVCSGRDYL